MSELSKGIKTESEHKGLIKKFFIKAKPKQLYKEIAKEHLKEDKKYYTKLKKAKL